MLDKCLPIWTLQQVPFRHILIATFMRIPNSMRILYKTTLLTELLEEYKQQMHNFIVFLFFLNYLTNAEYKMSS